MPAENRVTKLLEFLNCMKIKSLKISLSLIVFALIAMSFSTNGIDLSRYRVSDLELNYTVPNKSEMVDWFIPVAPKYSLFLGKSYLGFREALGFKESQGNYLTVNPYGYLGKYQFGKSTLHAIGIKNPESFLKNSKQQELAFSAYTSRNKWILRKDIKRNVGKTVGGVKITESGILAAAHLAGPGAVQAFLRSSGEQGFEDANGASIRYYLRMFSGYDVSHIIANRKAKVM